MKDLKELEKKYAELGQEIEQLKKQDECWYVDQPVRVEGGLSRYLATKNKSWCYRNTSRGTTHTWICSNITPDYDAPNIINWIPIDKYEGVDSRYRVTFYSKITGGLCGRDIATHYAIIKPPVPVN